MTQLTSKLVVDAGNPAVRIEVIDSDFQICAKGYGHIEKELPTGLYTIRYRAGDAQKEKNIKLQPDQPLEVLKPPKLEFGSAAPIEQTRASDHDQQNHAQRLSHAPQVERGIGAEVFLFVRDLAPGGKGHPMHGMSLHAIDGTRLVDLEKESSKSAEPDNPLWAGCNVALDPGRYRLRLVFRRGQSIETMIVACPNWQSQVFLLRPNGGIRQESSELLDLSTATQLMSRRGTGFDPKRISLERVDIEEAAQDLRLIELAHYAVANQWRGFHAKDLHALLKGKHYDPMLGILGLHLLLMKPEPDLEFAGQVLDRLRQNILQGFSHPDVEALGIEIALRQGREIVSTAVDSPPMLRRSWFLLLQATAKKSSLIPSDSFSSRIANRLWGSGAWLTWVTPEAKQSRRVDEVIWPTAEYRQTSTLRGLVDTLSERLLELDPRKFLYSAKEIESGLPEESLSKKDDFELLRKEMEEFLPSLGKLIEEHRSVEALAKKADLDRGEFTLLTFLNVNLQIDPTKSTSTASPSLTLESLVKSLGLPADRIETLMIGLLAKLTPLAEQNK